MPERREARQRTLRAHLGLARITNLPTTVSNVLAGAAIAAPLVFRTDLVLVVIAIALFYTAGMYLNDILDLESDRQEHPDRPLPSGRISAGEAWTVTLVLFAVGLALLLFVDRQSFIAGLALVAVIAIYDAWHKGNPIGPVIMAIARVLVYVVAFFAFASEATGELWLWGAVLLAYVSGLTYIGKTDGLPGAGRYWPLVTVLAPAAVAVFMEPTDVLVWSLAVAHVLWVAHSVSYAYRTSNRQVSGAVARLIAGISMLDALVLATHEAWWGALIAMGCLALTMVFQRSLKHA
jgi:hypothetical protein